MILFFRRWGSYEFNGTGIPAFLIIIIGFSAIMLVSISIYTTKFRRHHNALRGLMTDKESLREVFDKNVPRRLQVDTAKLF